MIFIVHKNNKPINVFQNTNKLDFENTTLSKLFFTMAQLYPQETIVWCHKKLQNHINISAINNGNILTMMSFSTSKTFVISKEIGYVEQSSPFININFNVQYPTWRMSSDIGFVNAKIINKVANKIEEFSNFEYFLNSFAKQMMPNGLLCYSNPALLKNEHPIVSSKKETYSVLFKFVAQHYKKSWTSILAFNLFVYQRKLPLFSYLTSFFYSKIVLKLNIATNQKSQKKEISNFDIDVIIPTIGRKKYLYDVLVDLNKQTILPKNVIIIEQNPSLNSQSNLDYLKNNTWKFKIKHQFIHQTGACNARNLALKKVVSDWVFFADDDIRIPVNFIKDSIHTITQHQVKAITVSCLLANETEKYKFPFQWATFGSGCSIVNMATLKNTNFDMAFEHGFGEDADFGMQLRNKGVDIIYSPLTKLLHLKAPIGGFRTTFEYAWKHEKIQPKPSPTVMLYNLKHNTTEQILGYKTLLFVKYYKIQSIKNPFKYLKMMKKRWEVSQKWSRILAKNNEI